jgi:uncharacterized protein YdcH (DUF465 family)
MLHEYRDIITHMKESEENNAHFLHIFDKHNALDDQIAAGEKGAMTDLELEKLKTVKLLLKDEAYTILMAYKKEHNL